jgi:MFS family permease
MLGFCHICADSLVLMFLSLYLKSRAIGEVKIGGLFGVYHAMLPLVVLGIGLLTDRASCRSLITVGSLIAAVYCGIFPSLNRTGLMGLIIGVGGIGLTLAFISLNVLFLKTIVEEKRGKYLSLFIASMSTGYAVGSMVGSLLIREFHLPPQIVFYVALGLHLICFILALGLPEAPIERFPLIKYFHDMKRIPVLCLAIIAFSLGIHWGAESYGIVRYMNDVLSVSGIQMAVFFFGIGIALAGFSRVAGYVIDHHRGFVKYLVFGLLLSGVMQGLTGLSRTYLEFFLVRVLHTCGDGFIICSVTILVSLAFPAGRMGGNYGFNRTMNSLGSVIGGPLSGFLVARYLSLGTPFLVTCLFQIIAAGFIWVLGSHLPLSESVRNK